jgi:hypothetical protein
MDCEKYEPLLLDELYEELDEVTSAAVKRHVAGCARCASVLNGMQGTRSLVVMPLEPLPAGLEERILAAAREAQKVVPLQSRFSRAVSIAGRWAMRPQTAMAAVFLLMIGSSAFLLRAKRDAAHANPVSVTMEGQPEPLAQVAATDTASLNTPAANTAHGAPPPVILATPPPTASASAAPTALAQNEPAGPMDNLTGGAARDESGKDKAGALGNAVVSGEKEEQAQGLQKADDATKKSYAPKPATRSAGPTNAGLPGGTAERDYGASQAAIPPPPAQRRAGDPPDGYSAGQASYRARNYVEATKQFDSAAQTGDQNAALWAAISVRDGNGGCGAALPRFEAVAKKASGSYTGNEAELDAAKCQVALGDLDKARARLQKLAQTSTHAAQAQAALGELNQVATKREAEKRGGGGSAGAGAAAAPRAAPAPAKTAADKAAGY